MISTLIEATANATGSDRAEALLGVATECYGLALRSISQYAAEIDPRQVAEFRGHLGHLEQQWMEVRSTEGFRAVHASFRGELREYHDKTREQLARLRKELESAAAAMSLFADGIATSGADCVDEFKRELARLESVTGSGDLGEIREGIHAAVGEMVTTLEKTRRGNVLIIAQLQEEIRLLHQEFQAERRALFTDPASGAWTKQKVELKLSDLFRQNDRFCVFAVAIRNLEQIKAGFSRTVVEGTFKALLTRFRGMLGDDALIGRWSEAQFVVILDVDADAIDEIAGEMATTLGGRYSIQENGLALSIGLELATGGCQRSPGTEAASFLHKLDQLTHSLMHAGQ